VTDGTKDQTSEKPAPEPEEGERPPPLQMLVLVLFPFAVMAIIALLYVWLRG
jgi:hypothetical protein